MIIIIIHYVIIISFCARYDGGKVRASPAELTVITGCI